VIINNICNLFSVGQEKDLKNLHESLKQDTKLWKQGIEMLPKQMRKEAMAKRKEEKDIEYAEKVHQLLQFSFVSFFLKSLCLILKQ